MAQPAQFTFPRRARITNAAGFKAARKGKRFETRCLVVYIRHRLADDTARLGITVSKRVARRAVTRNRLRRQLREVFRRARPVLASDVDIVLIAKPVLCEACYQEIVEELDTVFGSAGLFSLGEGRTN